MILIIHDDNRMPAIKSTPEEDCCATMPFLSFFTNMFKADEPVAPKRRSSIFSSTKK